MEFQWYLKEGQRLFHGDLKMFQGILMMFQEDKGSFNSVECFKGVSIKNKSFLRVFLLHGTHPSYPSRRRACFWRE